MPRFAANSVSLPQFTLAAIFLPVLTGKVPVKNIRYFCNEESLNKNVTIVGAVPQFVTNYISFAAAVNLAAYSFRCSSPP